MLPSLFLTAALTLSLPPGAGSPVAEQIDEFATRLEGFGWSGSILLEVDGRTLLRKGYGLANRPGGLPYDGDTLFDIGSMAKTFTAAAVLRLQQDGRLALGDRIADHLAGVPPDKREITIEQLLTHTSGLTGDVPSSGDPHFDEVGRDEVVRRILATELEFPSGTDWSYSNGGFVLLAAIVEQAAGTPFRQYIGEEILSRAGLRHTLFWGEAAGERIAAGHDELGNVLHDPATASKTSWFDLGGGQMMSSLDDLRAWAHALRDGAVISRPLAEAMFAPQTKVVSARKGSSGYGWFVQGTSPHKVLVQHGGDTVGAGAELKWWVTQGVLLVTSTNVRHDLYPTRNRLEPVLAAILFGERPAASIPSFVLADTPPPVGIEGDYRLESGGTLHLERIRGRLYLGATGQDATALLAPATAELERQREQRGAAARQALAALAQGDPAPLDLLSGGTPTEHGFRDAVKQEIDSLGQKPLRSITLLGTSATGFPHGDPPSTETTLLRLSFADRSVTYAIRWNADSMIGFTEVVALPHAAMLPLQRTLDGSWVGWNIVKEHGVSLELVPPSSLRLTSADRTVSAIRLDP